MTPESRKENPLSVSLLLLTRNGMPAIEQTLGQLRAQDYAGAVETICIDSESDDGTAELLRRSGYSVETIRHGEFHHGRTRNRAAALANNDVLVFLSQDAVPVDNQWLANLLHPFEDSAVAAVYGRQVPPAGLSRMRAHGLAMEYPDQREVRRAPESGRIPLRFIRFSNVNSAIRANVWQRFPFSEDVLVAEDQGFCYQALSHGMTVVYEPAAAVVHGHDWSLRGAFRWAFDNGLSLKRIGVFDDRRIGSETAYGLRRLQDDWRWLSGKGQYRAAVQSVLVAGVKWAGVQIGKRERILPKCLVRRISLNWRQ